jgi:hypothetical protein
VADAGLQARDARERSRAAAKDCWYWKPQRQSKVIVSRVRVCEGTIKAKRMCAPHSGQVTVGTPHRASEGRVLRACEAFELSSKIS